MRHYHQAAIESASGVQLVVVLYDGLHRFRLQAASACESKNEAARREAARRALNIIIHLQSTLRMDIGGEPAQRLCDFYTGVFADILRASATASQQLFLDTARDVRSVREAWQVAAQNPHALDAVVPDSQFQLNAQSARPILIRPDTASEPLAAPAWIA